MAQVVRCLPTNYKALSSKLILKKKKLPEPLMNLKVSSGNCFLSSRSSKGCFLSYHAQPVPKEHSLPDGPSHRAWHPAFAVSSG
jgi:hypothetical protein